MATLKKLLNIAFPYIVITLFSISIGAAAVYYYPQLKHSDQMSKFVKSGISPKMAQLLFKNIDKYKLHHRWADFAAICWVESTCKFYPKDNRNRNRTIDVGPFQINSVHFKYGRNFKDPSNNVEWAAGMFKKCLDDNKQDGTYCAGIHNSGPNATWFRRSYQQKFIEARAKIKEGRKL